MGRWSTPPRLLILFRAPPRIVVRLPTEPHLLNLTDMTFDFAMQTLYSSTSPEIGPLRAVHLSRHKWPGRLVN